MKLEAIRYDLIHQLEDKYGSLTHCRDDDPLLLKLRAYHSQFNRTDLQTKIKPMTKRAHIYKDRLSKATVYVKQGYSCKEASVMADTSYSNVYYLIAHSGVAVRPKFKCIYKDMAIDTYKDVATLLDIYTLMNYWEHIENYMKSHKGALKQVNLRWGQLPDSTKYVVNGKVYIKHGIDSFMKEVVK